MKAMVLSVIGKDKPGLVDDIATVVRKVEGNWLKSSFCQLSGHFAGFVEIMLPEDNHQELVEICQRFSNLHITPLPAYQTDTEKNKRIAFVVTGNDRRGIVSDVTSCLKSFNLNILELHTTCESAPNWGSQLFSANIVIDAPQEFEASEIIEAVERIADDLMVDLKSEPK